MFLVNCGLFYLKGFIEIRGRPSPGHRKRPVFRVPGQVNQPAKLPSDVHAGPIRGHLVCCCFRRGSGVGSLFSEGVYQPRVFRFIGALIARELARSGGVIKGQATQYRHTLNPTACLAYRVGEPGTRAEETAHRLRNPSVEPVTPAEYPLSETFSQTSDPAFFLLDTFTRFPHPNRRGRVERRVVERVIQRRIAEIHSVPVAQGCVGRKTYSVGAVRRTSFRKTNASLDNIL